ncbi:leucyl aminopeptidase [Candidatus Woesearchaeota archaeon]|nr:leucyl aminopeptidase [Candidatus Woesearchaeota archaeon]
MKLEFAVGPIDNVQTDVVVLSLSEEEVKSLSTETEFDKLIAEEVKSNEFKGELSQILFFHTKNRLPTKYVLAVGLGKNEEVKNENIRRAFSAAAKKINSVGLKKVHILVKDKTCAKAVTEGLVLTNYSFDKYKTEEKNKAKHFEEVTFVHIDPADIEDDVRDTSTVCHCTLFVRDLVNEPPNLMNPEQLELIARKVAKAGRLRITVLNEKQLQKSGLNLILNVGKSSSFPPRLIILEYRGAKKNDAKTALVGKGVTFDSGGVNLKPTGMIETMKCDMAGAGTVLGSILAAAKLKLNKNIVAIIPAVENMIGSRAYRPSDVVTAYNGKTVEIGNTDAEGRLILADALSFVEKNYKPTKIIDLATLTGTCRATFGEHAAALLSQDDNLSNELFNAGKETYERVWRLPLYDEYKEEIKGEVADITNLGYNNGKYAGTITGAAFLNNFVTTNSWAHLDIASTAWSDKEKHYIPKNGTGFGVRLLIEWLKK